MILGKREKFRKILLDDKLGLQKLKIERLGNEKLF